MNVVVNQVSNESACLKILKSKAEADLGLAVEGDANPSEEGNKYILYISTAKVCVNLHGVRLIVNLWKACLAIVQNFLPHQPESLAFQST